MIIDVEFSIDGIRQASRKLHELAYTIPIKTDTYKRMLIMDGQTILANRLMSISDYDGNNMGVININPDSLSWQGEQIAYLEFGTGTVGITNPYPIEIPTEWECHDHTWSYIDTDGKRRVTQGIPAYAPMYHTAQDIKAEIPNRFKNLL